MITILLATHNGGVYLRRFLRSLAEQSVGDWHLLARDDGSSDNTLAILSEFAAAHGRLTLVSDCEGRKGACHNFGALMHRAAHTAAEYVLFADQDDIWLPDKLERQLAVMRSAEATYGREVPHLVYSDLTVVDRDSRVVHPSFGRYACIYRDHDDPLRALLVYNCVTGCASLLNRPLLEAAMPVPHEAVMHDWWVALCAAAFGRIHFLDRPTVLYRQHGGNLIGARGFWRMLNPLQTKWRDHWHRAMQVFLHSGLQARALKRRLQDRHEQANRGALDVVERYCHALETETVAWRRVAAVRRLGIGRLNLFRQATLAARLWSIPHSHTSTPGATSRVA